MTPQQKLADDIMAIAIAVEGDPLTLLLSEQEIDCLLRAMVGAQRESGEYELHLTGPSLANVIRALHANSDASKPPLHAVMDQDHVDRSGKRIEPLDQP